MSTNVNIINKFGKYKHFKIGELGGGGIIVSYKCTNRCRHCLVVGAPEREDQWIKPEFLDSVYKKIKKSGPNAQIHISGGEAFLNPDCCLYSMELAAKNDIFVDYIETNGFWGGDSAKYMPLLKELKKLGLKSILISVSPFHSEFIKPQATVDAIAAVKEVFGPEGAFVWIPDFLNVFDMIDKDKPLKIDKLPERFLKMIPDMYYLIPGGRAGYLGEKFFKKWPAKTFFMTDCIREFASTAHFHIDYMGYYMPGGLCGGLSICDYREIGTSISLEDKPILSALINGGIKALFDFAKEEYGYEPEPEGYCGKCHLCVDIRKFLYDKQDFKELKPAEFYKFLKK